MSRKLELVRKRKLNPLVGITNDAVTPEPSQERQLERIFSKPKLVLKQSNLRTDRSQPDIKVSSTSVPRKAQELNRNKSSI